MLKRKTRFLTEKTETGPYQRYKLKDDLKDIALVKRLCRVYQLTYPIDAKISADKAGVYRILPAPRGEITEVRPYL